VTGQHLAHLQFDQVGEFRVGRVGLVQGHDDVPHADLPGEQDVLAGLRHHALERGHHEDRAVGLGRAGDHVLHVVGVAGHVHMGVMPRCGLVLDVRDVDGDPAHDLFGRAVDPLERDVRRGAPPGQDLGDRGGQGRLAVIDVSHGADVEVRLGPRVRLLGHVRLLSCASLSRDPHARATLPRRASRPPLAEAGRRDRGRVSFACRAAGTRRLTPRQPSSPAPLPRPGR
jgi:hypothetical protein